MIFEKIGPQHLERKAILYVRQSSAHQVLHNRESSALQYAMRDRLAALGWSRIETVDDDLGRSAAGGVARAGFDRMVAEVCLGKVGAVCQSSARRQAARASYSRRRPPAHVTRGIGGLEHRAGNNPGTCGLDWAGCMALPQGSPDGTRPT